MLSHCFNIMQLLALSYAAAVSADSFKGLYTGQAKIFQQSKSAAPRELTLKWWWSRGKQTWSQVFRGTLTGDHYFQKGQRPSKVTGRCPGWRLPGKDVQEMYECNLWVPAPWRRLQSWQISMLGLKEMLVKSYLLHRPPECNNVQKTVQCTIDQWQQPAIILRQVNQEWWMLQLQMGAELWYKCKSILEVTYLIGALYYWYVASTELAPPRSVDGSIGTVNTEWKWSWVMSASILSLIHSLRLPVMSLNLMFQWYHSARVVGSENNLQEVCFHCRNVIEVAE